MNSNKLKLATFILFMVFVVMTAEAGIQREVKVIHFIVESKEDLTEKTAKLVVLFGGDGTTKFDLSTRDEKANGISLTFVTLTIKL